MTRTDEVNATTILSADEEREAFYRHVFMGERQADVADVLGVSASTVSKVVRAFESHDGDRVALEENVLGSFTDDEDPRDDAGDRRHLRPAADVLADEYTDEHGYAYTTRDDTNGDPVITMTCNDGSRATFYLGSEFETRVVRVGPDDTIMFSRELADGSCRTFTCPTELYEDHAAEFAEYVTDDERDTDTDDDTQELVADGGEDREIDTGIQAPENADGTAIGVDPDVWAFADGGEYATTWAIECMTPKSVRVETHRHEAGLDEVDGDVAPVELPDSVSNVGEFARMLARTDPEMAIENARKYYADKDDDEKCVRKTRNDRSVVPHRSRDADADEHELSNTRDPKPPVNYDDDTDADAGGAVLGEPMSLGEFGRMLSEIQSGSLSPKEAMRQNMRDDTDAKPPEWPEETCPAPAADDDVQTVELNTGHLRAIAHDETGTKDPDRIEVVDAESDGDTLTLSYRVRDSTPTGELREGDTVEVSYDPTDDDDTGTLIATVVFAGPDYTRIDPAYPGASAVYIHDGMLKSEPVSGRVYGTGVDIERRDDDGGW